MNHNILRTNAVICQINNGTWIPSCFDSSDINSPCSCERDSEKLCSIIYEDCWFDNIIIQNLHTTGMSSNTVSDISVPTANAVKNALKNL